MWSDLDFSQICVFQCTRFHWKFVRFYMTKRCFMGTEAVVEMVINQGGLAQMEISISHLFLRAWKMVASLSHLSITSAQNSEFCCNNFESHKRWLKSNLKFVLGFSKCLLHVMSQRNLIEHDLRSWHDDFWGRLMETNGERQILRHHFKWHFLRFVLFCFSYFFPFCI